MNENCIYGFEVKYFDEIDNKIKSSKGYTIAKSYKKATEKVSEYFGERELESVRIELWAPNFGQWSDDEENGDEDFLYLRQILKNGKFWW